MPYFLSSVGNCNNFVLIFLNVFWVFLSGHRRVVFSLCCSCFCIIFLDYLLSELFDKQRHLAGNFRGVWRSSLLELLILAVSLLSIYWCFVAMLHTVGQFHSFALVEFCWVILLFWLALFFFFVFSYAG
jgi:hypothetical protein